MRAADLTTAALLIAAGLLVLADAIRLGPGWGTDGPGSGFFPFWLALIMVVACAAIAAQAWHRQDRTQFISRDAMGPVLKVLVPAIAFVIVTQFAGIYVASALYMAVYMRWIGRYGWPLIAVVSVAFPVVTFWVFELWFLVPMPKGPLEAWLGY